MFLWSFEDFRSVPAKINNSKKILKLRSSSLLVKI